MKHNQRNEDYSSPLKKKDNTKKLHIRATFTKNERQTKDNAWMSFDFGLCFKTTVFQN